MSPTLRARPPVIVMCAAVIVVLIVGAALLAPWIAPHRESDFFGVVWGPPSAANLLGTDNLGRDMLTRLIYGARNTVGIATLTTAIAFLIGVTSGFVAASVGGWVDTAVSRCVEILLCVPVLISSLMVISVLGNSIPVLIGTIGILESTRVYIIARAVARTVTVREFVSVARLRGEGLAWVICREMLPNALHPLIAEAGLRFSFIFLFIASLSFLGLGIQPPAADWGSMVRENAQAINFGLYAPLYPASAIALLTIGINLLVDRFATSQARPGGHAIEI
ncbi:MAG: transporter permease [Gammaproteobacteria bacterium]|jgi:peptide/nickel transport system permease protein|nr:transporter permease [Gammaproteobacteria bacterium]HEV7448877.1 ABC transporter permease [Steroidobacteraceae bacterium]